MRVEKRCDDWYTLPRRYSRGLSQHLSSAGPAEILHERLWNHKVTAFWQPRALPPVVLNNASVNILSSAGCSMGWKSVAFYRSSAVSSPPGFVLMSCGSGCSGVCDCCFSSLKMMFPRFKVSHVLGYILRVAIWTYAYATLSDVSVLREFLADLSTNEL